MKQNELIRCLEDFPEGAYLDQVWEWFGHLPNLDTLKTTLGRLVAKGIVEKVPPVYDQHYLGIAQGPVSKRGKYKLVREASE